MRRKRVTCLTTGDDQLLSVMHSVLAPDAIAHFVEQNYVRGFVTDCSLLRSYVNDVYALQTTAGERLIFKLFRKDWRNETDVKWEVDLQLHLRGHGTPASEPLAQRDGSYVAEIHAPEGARAGVLLAWLEGEKPQHPFTDALYFRHGASLAEFHASLDDFPHIRTARNYDASALIDRPLRTIEQVLDPSSTTAATVRRVAAGLRERMSDIQQVGGWGICHGDPTMDNVHLLPDGRHAFLDFDLAGNCWRGLDLSAIYEWAHRDPSVQSFWSAFLAGYSSERSFSAAEAAMLPAVAAAWELQDIGHELEHWSRWSGSWRMTHVMLRERIDRLSRWDVD